MVALAPVAARADVASASATPSATDEPRGAVWYGWQILAADIAATGVAYMGLRAGSAVVGATGLLAIPVAGPIVHGMHDEQGKGMTSLALNLGLLAAGAVIGGSSVQCDPKSLFPELCKTAAAALGAFVGLQTAVLIDAFGLAWKSPPQGDRGQTFFTVTPTVSITAGASTIGLAGQF